jgi:hypothetical protein
MGWGEGGVNLWNQREITGAATTRARAQFEVFTINVGE